MTHHHKTYTLKSRHDALPLSVLTVEAIGEMRGVVQLSHGMSEYKERYIPLMDYLSDHGYASIIHDHRGHGKSVHTESDLGYFYNDGASGVIVDLLAVTDYAKSRWPNAPFCLMGHSMGSLAARVYAKQYDSAIDALIVCGCPGQNPASKPGELFIRLSKLFLGGRHKSRLFDALVLGGFSRAIKGAASPFSWVNSDETAVKQYEDDPLCGFSFTLNGYLALLSLMSNTYSKKNWTVNNPGLPILFVSGEDDPCMVNRERFDKAVQLMKDVGYTNVNATLYPGMRHEILNEPGKARVYEDIAAFLDESFIRG